MENHIARFFRFTVIVSLVITIPLISTNCLLAQNKQKQKVINKKFIFNRALVKEDGKGGFAYQGVRLTNRIEDHLLASVEKAPPASPWFETEKLFYKNLIKKGSYDLLVVPFQTQLDGVDPIGRSLMSYRLAVEIERQTSMKVAPLPIVHLALGSHARYYDDTDIYSFAESIGVSHIIWGFAGTHEDKEGHLKGLDITIVYQHKSDFGLSSGSRGKTWKKRDFKSYQLPSQLFESSLNEVMAFIDLPSKKADKFQKTTHHERPPTPLSPETFFKIESQEGIYSSWLYQFMGMLTPPRSEFHRQYMFTRSLAALTGVNANHPDYAILKARAYHYLNRRPAALQVLQNDISSSALFLREIINGNLPQLESFLENMSPSIDKLFCTLEYAWMRYRYTNKYPQKQIDEILSQHPDWQYFLKIAFKDADGWQVPHNLILKQTMDQYFPVKDYSLQTIIADASTSKDPQTIALEINLSFQKHSKKSLSHLSRSKIFEHDTQGPNALDFHLWMEGVGVSNLLKQINFLANIQCLPKEAKELCGQYLSVYDGHPYFELYYADILKNEVSKLQGAEKQKKISECVTNAKLGLWWYGRQGWSFSLASSILRPNFSSDKDLLNKIIPYKFLLYGIASDYPFIPKLARKGFMRPHEDLIDWSSYDIEDAKFLANIYRDDQERMALVQEKIKGRFLGHPNRYKLEMPALPTKQSAQDEKKLYIQLISKSPQNWKLYKKLGKMYLAEGEYKKAQETFLNYPGFKPLADENPVRISNRADDCADLLYWRGAYGEARPLYEISANLKTGSAASLHSSLKLALMDLDLDSAARVALLLTQRYDSAYGNNDYMSILHIQGDSATAWNQFKNLIGRYKYPSIWTSAWVGHRIQNTRLEDLQSWISDMADKSPTSKQRGFPARFALMCLNDRAPNMEMAEFVGTVDDLALYDFSNNFMFKGPNKKPIGPEHFGTLLHTEFVDRTSQAFKPSNKLMIAKKQYYEQEIPKEPFSFYGSFAKAYEKLKTRSYAKAYEQLKIHSLVYSYSMDMGKPLKPYLVWAGMQSGHHETIEHYLHGVLIQAGLKKPPYNVKAKSKDMDFDDQLSLAAYACGLGDDDLAFEYIQKAYYNRPGSAARPISSMYQIMEMCEWFYERSKDHRFLELVLKWSKAFQVIRPMYGYPYAFEAKHTINEQDKIRALAYALYLDPQSWRITHFSENEKSRAREWFQKHNKLANK